MFISPFVFNGSNTGGIRLFLDLPHIGVQRFIIKFCYIIPTCFKRYNHCLSSSMRISWHRSVRMASAFSIAMGIPSVLIPWWGCQRHVLPSACRLHALPVISLPNVPGRWFSAPMGAIVSYSSVPAPLSVSHSVSLFFMGWAVSIPPSGRRDSLRHSYRPRLSPSALRLFTFSCSHSPLNLGAYLCDVDIIPASKSMQLPCSFVQGCRCKLASDNLCFINE